MNTNDEMLRIGPIIESMIDPGENEVPCYVEIHPDICRFITLYFLWKSYDLLPIDKMFSAEFLKSRRPVRHLDIHEMCVTAVMLDDIRQCGSNHDLPYPLMFYKADYFVQALLNPAAAMECYNWLNDYGDKTWKEYPSATDTDATPPPSRN